MAKITRTLYINYEQTRTGGEVCVGEDEDNRWASHEIVYFSTTFHNASFKEPKKFFRDSISVEEKFFDAKVIYLGVVIYSDGDTFGGSSGNCEFIGAFESEDEAYDALKELTEDESKSSESLYKPWEGYFSSLEGVEVHRLEVV